MTEFFAALAGFVVIVIVLLLVLKFFFPTLLNRLRRIAVSGDGIEIEFHEAAERAATEKGGSVPQRPPGDWRDRRILWVDDHPENNVNEIAMFKALGATVTSVQTNATAVAALGDGNFDIVISDIGRDATQETGLTLPEDIEAAGLTVPPLVYYTGHAGQYEADTTHPVTDTPDALIRSIVAALDPA